MICPNCKGITIIKTDKLQICNRCGAEEMNIDGFKDRVWRLSSGRIVSSPDAEIRQKEKAKEEWPSGLWD